MSWNFVDGPEKKRHRYVGELVELDNSGPSDRIPDNGWNSRILASPVDDDMRANRDEELPLALGKRKLGAYRSPIYKPCFLQATDDVDFRGHVEFVAGGHCPITPGDTLFTHRVLKQLGCGAYATVWLGYDHKNRKYNALKVTKPGKMDKEGLLKEIKFMNMTGGRETDHIGLNHIVQLETTFNINSRNGAHVVLGLEVLGPSLHRASQSLPNHRYPMKLVKRIMRQVLLACDYLHTKCRVIHCDLKPDNILIAISEGDIQRMGETAASIETMQMNVELENKKTVSFPLYYSFDLSKAEERLMVKIGDFGISCFTNEKLSRRVQTCEYRSPEAFLRADLTTEADIWSCACIAYELATGKNLFPCNRYVEGHELMHLEEICNLFGPMSCSVFNNARDELLYFKNGKFIGRLVHGNGVVMSSYLELRHQIPSEDAKVFGNFLHQMLRYDPVVRATAGEVLTHPFLERSESDIYEEVFPVQPEENNAPGNEERSIRSVSPVPSEHYPLAPVQLDEPLVPRSPSPLVFPFPPPPIPQNIPAEIPQQAIPPTPSPINRSPFMSPHKNTNTSDSKCSRPNSPVPRLYRIRDPLGEEGIFYLVEADSPYLPYFRVD